MLPGNQIIKHSVDPQNDPGRYKMEIIRKYMKITHYFETYLHDAFCCVNTILTPVVCGPKNAPMSPNLCSFARHWFIIRKGQILWLIKGSEDFYIP